MKPETDGIDHINIYSKGRTELGRLLSNFAQTPFRLSYGRFASVEGLWYWLLAPESSEKEALKVLYGFNAKRLGRRLVTEQPEYGQEFRRKILQAFYAKLDAHFNIRKLLLETEPLPFTHYYVFDGFKKEVTSHLWQIDYWERIRREVREGLF
jgi:predicted NAD-dependent protein-ADP-ribosyltransferase YbiA (DUF1768 family)